MLMVRRAGFLLSLAALGALHSVIAGAAEPVWSADAAVPRWLSLSRPAASAETASDIRQRLTSEPGETPPAAFLCRGGGDGIETGCAASRLKCDELFALRDEPLLNDHRNRTLVGDLRYSLGGELRHRYLDEHNRLRPQGTVAPSTYQQWRFTPFLEVENEWIGGYVRAIDAPTFGEDLPVLPIDVNRFDLMEYYLDARLSRLDGGDLRGRYGRMTLQYGDQHLISPLAWANTFRTFEGGRVYYTGENWTIDAIAVRPTNGAASAAAFYPESFDQADQSVLLSGVYATWTKAPHGAVDLYWLWNREDEPSFDPLFGYNRQDGSRHTLGLRYAGAVPVSEKGTTLRTWSWDLQGGWQVGEDHFGAQTDQDVSAGFLSAVAGVRVDRLPWKPSMTGLFWWGSGDADTSDGRISTINTLYPLGHAYWGMIDNFNGANLLDYSVQFAVQPRDRLSLAAHMHWFEKASAGDYIYNIAGAPLGNTTTPQRHIGNELDLLLTWQASQSLQIQFGYFWFWYGDAVNDQPALARDDARQFYVMTTWNF